MGVFAFSAASALNFEFSTFLTLNDKWQIVFSISEFLFTFYKNLLHPIFVMPYNNKICQTNK